MKAVKRLTVPVESGNRIFSWAIKIKRRYKNKCETLFAIIKADVIIIRMHSIQKVYKYRLYIMANKCLYSRQLNSTDRANNWVDTVELTWLR